MPSAKWKVKNVKRAAQDVEPKEDSAKSNAPGTPPNVETRGPSLISGLRSPMTNEHDHDHAHADAHDHDHADEHNHDHAHADAHDHDPVSYTHLTLPTSDLV